MVHATAPADPIAQTDHDVSELAGQAPRTGTEGAVEDQARPDAGPDEDHHHVGAVATRSVALLGQGRDVDVIAHRHVGAAAGRRPTSGPTAPVDPNRAGWPWRAAARRD